MTAGGVVRVFSDLPVVPLFGRERVLSAEAIARAFGVPAPAIMALPSRVDLAPCLIDWAARARDVRRLLARESRRRSRKARRARLRASRRRS